MANSRIALLVIGIVLLAQLGVPEPLFGQLQCTGKYKGLRPSPAELADILKQHAAWVKDGGLFDPKLVDDPRRANLCGASLTMENLDGVDLSGADLSRANLNGADLTGAKLVGASLSNANLPGASLRGAFAAFADLTSANLLSADLRGANLHWAKLGGTDLTDAKLDGASLSLANLAGTDLEIDPDALPKITDIDTAYNLQLVKFQDEPAALVKLRSEFKEQDMRTQEAELTYAIRRSELSRKAPFSASYVHSWFERWFNTLCFDWTCQYGMSPGRPLLIVAVLAAILSIIYIFAQVNPGRSGGIWAVWDEHRIKQGEGSKEPQQLTDGFPSGHSELGFLLLAVYFSLLSATRIGWRELNVGTWITRIQPREYTLRATGWVRVVSGLQSLISVYLVALTILTYFGTPFEY